MKSVASGEWRVASGKAGTLREALVQATTELAAAGPSPRTDAEALLMHVSRLDRAGLIVQGERVLTENEAQHWKKLLARRRQGEPVAYLTGWREFWSLSLRVTPDVLIPRPETELLVEKALARIPPDAEWTIADLGTGSGAIALAIAKERPRCRIIATDVSETALAIARENAEQLGLTNVEFRCGDWFAPLAGLRFDVIVSNPPYVAENDPHLAQGDVRFEPRAALTAGRDGLDAIRMIALQTRNRLRAGGVLLFEHGCDQSEAVRHALRESGYRDIVCHEDLAGHARVTEGRLDSAD